MGAGEKHQGRFVAYYRVSTKKQERSGLGLEAQRAAVIRYLDGGRWRPIGEFTETESGRKNERPELEKALALCKAKDATLIVAKLDRLARNVRFLLKVVEESPKDRGVIFCDMPNIPEGPDGKLIITQMAAFAEWEAKRISQRIVEALKERKKKGGALGKSGRALRAMQVKGAAASAKVRHRQVQAQRNALHTIACALRLRRTDGKRRTLVEVGAELEKAGHKAPRGGKWHAASVKRILA